MYVVFVADVGDGLCMAINTPLRKRVQIDWGGEAREPSLQAIERIVSNLGTPDVFILSHFHLDHYRGLLYACTNNFIRLQVEKVFFPRIPFFPKREIFLRALFTINLLTFGKESGIAEYDFLQCLYNINDVPFRYKALSKGDHIEIGGIRFKILWPPKEIGYTNLPKTYAKIERSLREFCEILEKDEDLKRIWDYVGEEGIFEPYLKASEEEVIDRYLDKVRKPLRGKIKISKGKLSSNIQRANRVIKSAANHISLVMVEEDNLLFLGDVDKEEIREIIYCLFLQDKRYFNVIITPHHGTHWDDSLYNLRCLYSITSNGRKNVSKMSPNFKKIAYISLATFSNGDLLVPIQFIPIAPLFWVSGK